MWNRVVLLVSGTAVGWTLVLYASAPEMRRRAYLWRLLGAAGVGVALIGWLSASGAAVGLAATLVFLFSALVAYAANARQVNRAPERETLPRPDAPPEGQQGVALLLAIDGEPRYYEGPAHWARRLLERAGRERRAPAWLVRPWAYARVRSAYARMGGENAQRAAQAALIARLADKLTEVAYVGDAYLDTAPVLADELLRLTQRGMRRIVLVPLAVGADDLAWLSDEVERTRVREVGVQVGVAPALDAGAWPLPAGDPSLDCLLRGEPLAAPATPSEAQVAALAEELARRVATEPKPEW